MEPLQSTDPAQIGPFRLAARLGAGGMGLVYLAHSAAGRRVAVKVVHARYAADAGFRARFRREVTTARAVGGAFTAAILDADPDAPSPWLATEFVAGPSLHAAVAEHGPFDVAAAVRLGAGLADALVAIHRAGVVHRDLKPANVLLAADGPRVIDFGIAHPADGTRITAAGGVIGSPGYMAPEQLMGTAADAGPAIDVFALGAVLVFATTGENPFGPAPVPVLLYRLSHEDPRLDAVPDAELRELLARCLRRDPGARPTADAVLDALAARLHPAEIPSTSTGPTDTGPPSAPPTTADPPDTPATRTWLPNAAPTRTWLPSAVAADIARVERELPAPPATGRVTSRRRVLIGAAVGVAVAAGGGVAALLANGGGAPVAEPAPPPTPPPGPAPTAAVGPRVGLQRWQATLDYVSAGPAAGPDLVYVGDLQTVRALDAGSGEQRWSAPGGGEFRANLALDGDALFAGNADGHVYALDAATGDRRWRRPVDDFLDTDPVVADGVVYAVGAFTDGADSRGHVVALDARTGSRRWAREIRTRRRPAHVDGDTVLVPATDALLALDAGSGAERWRVPLTEPTPAVSAAGTAYCGDQTGTLHALDLRTGAVQWTTSASPDELRVAPAVEPDGRRLFLCDEAGNLVMVDLAQRSTGWQFAAGASSPPVVRAGRILVAGYHVVHAVDVATGRPLWRFDAAGPADPLDGGSYFDERGRPAVTDDSVYFGDAGGAFFALDAAGGSGPAPG